MLESILNFFKDNFQLILIGIIFVLGLYICYYLYKKRQLNSLHSLNSLNTLKNSQVYKLKLDDDNQSYITEKTLDTLADDSKGKSCKMKLQELLESQSNTSNSDLDNDEDNTESIEPPNSTEHTDHAESTKNKYTHKKALDEFLDLNDDDFDIKSADILSEDDTESDKSELIEELPDIDLTPVLNSNTHSEQELNLQEDQLCQQPEDHHCHQEHQHPENQQQEQQPEHQQPEYQQSEHQEQHQQQEHQQNQPEHQQKELKTKQRGRPRKIKE
jgi:hypothetical protein